MDIHTIKYEIDLVAPSLKRRKIANAIRVAVEEILEDRNIVYWEMPVYGEISLKHKHGELSK